MDVTSLIASHFMAKYVQENCRFSLLGQEQLTTCCAKCCEWNWLTLEPLADGEGPERPRPLVTLRNIVLDLGEEDPAALFRELMH